MASLVNGREEFFARMKAMKEAAEEAKKSKFIKVMSFDEVVRLQNHGPSLCQATMMNGKPCKSSAVCGKYCKRHKF
jgi:hypothetical protein